MAEQQYPSNLEADHSQRISVFVGFAQNPDATYVHVYFDEEFPLELKVDFERMMQGIRLRLEQNFNGQVSTDRVDVRLFQGNSHGKEGISGCALSIRDSVVKGDKLLLVKDIRGLVEQFFRFLKN